MRNTFETVRDLRRHTCHLLLGLSFLVSAACEGGQTNRLDVGGLTQQGDVSLGDEVVAVGRIDTIAGHSLHQVRGAIWKPGRLLVVANGASGELRVYDSEGRHIRTFGRLGSGPGEYQLLTALWAGDADSLITHDRQNSRLSYWSTDGDLLRETELDFTTGLFAPLSNGWFLGIQVPPPYPAGPGTTRTDTAALIRVNPASDTSAEIARSAWQTYYGATTPTGDELSTVLPLEPRGTAASGSSRIYISSGAEWSVEQYSSTGEPLGAVEAAVQRRPLTDDLRELWQDPFLDKVSLRERPGMRRYLNSLPYPDSLPALDQLVVDELDNLWVRQFSIPGEESAKWFVFSPKGEQIAVLSLPSSLQPVQIGADFFVAVSKPQDAAEHVVVFSLQR